MFKIMNYYEKRLYVARYAIRKNMETMDGKRIYEIWSSYWKKDWCITGNKKLKLVENGDYFEFTLLNATDLELKELKHLNKSFKKLQEWMNYYLSNHTTIDDVDNDIVGLRDKQHRILISKFKHLNYYVKMANPKINEHHPIQYYIWKESRVKSGSFDKMIKYYEEMVWNKC